MVISILAWLAMSYEIKNNHLNDTISNKDCYKQFIEP